MANKVLVFGGTGPAGICLLRELLFRQHETTVIARNPSKIPPDLASNPLLEIRKGELTDTDAISTAVSNARAIISLLGPNTLRGVNPGTYSNFYRILFGIMRLHGVKRIFAMGTISISVPEDVFSVQRMLLVGLVRLVVPTAYQSVLAIARVFVEDGEGVEWTVYRIGGIPGGCDEASWKNDREEGQVFEGYIGQKGWCSSQKRGALARWLVDAVEDGKEEWIGRMPAVSRLAGSGRRE